MEIINQQVEGEEEEAKDNDEEMKNEFDGVSNQEIKSIEQMLNDEKVKTSLNNLLFIYGLLG